MNAHLIAFTNGFHRRRISSAFCLILIIINNIIQTPSFICGIDAAYVPLTTNDGIERVAHWSTQTQMVESIVFHPQTARLHIGLWNDAGNFGTLLDNGTWHFQNLSVSVYNLAFEPGSNPQKLYACGSAPNNPIVVLVDDVPIGPPSLGSGAIRYPFRSLFNVAVHPQTGDLYTVARFNTTSTRYEVSRF
jgi:hypothetical protein